VTALAAAAPEDGLTGWVIDVVERLGGPGIGFLVALENVFPPLPSEVILPVAGFAASRGTLTLAEAILWSTAGSVVGALVLYGLGIALGTERLARIADRIPLLTATDVYRADAWFDRYGPVAVLVGRIIPQIRSLISIPAGVSGMRLLTFAVFTAIGSGVWNVILVVAGYLLGEEWERVGNYVEPIGIGVVVVVVAIVAWFVVQRVRSMRARPQR
jgi:membrane protein DedA with SNARE-associated domain